MIPERVPVVGLLSVTDGDVWAVVSLPDAFALLTVTLIGPESSDLSAVPSL